ncbi:hypothetical protein MtrunA17_Chr7g0234451 [Medicago truncatula]|uniref:Uncharacterized protein n=1 Tax=Medicago truncatula TaxID=3880 RepID=A0A396H1Z1_MEDTR|nr:hypothetical protein MtrunA17_Chr7g0234451 [Medicago truncatula]
MFSDSRQKTTPFPPLFTLLAESSTASATRKEAPAILSSAERTRGSS